MTTTTPIIPTDAQVGAKLHRLARLIAAALVLGFVIGADIFQLLRSGVQNFRAIAYESGFAFGTWMHNLNDRFSAFSAELHAHPMDTLTPIVTEVAQKTGTKCAEVAKTTYTQITQYAMTLLESTAPAQEPAPAFVHPLSEIATGLECMTVAQLKRINSTTKKHKKQELVAMALTLA